LQGITPPGMTAKSPDRPKNRPEIAERMGYAILISTKRLQRRLRPCKSVVPLWALQWPFLWRIIRDDFTFDVQLLQACS